MSSEQSDYPVVVSFAAGDEYYHERAVALRDACDALDLAHSIDLVDDLEGRDWSQVCRYKIQFYKRKLEELGRPILWVDVDTHLAGRPEVLRGSRIDFAAFPVSPHLNRFDPYTVTRMWRAGLLYFGYTDTARGFVQHMVDLDAAEPASVTDAHILQEAWATFPTGMNVLVLPTKHIARDQSAISDDTWIVDGHSGNVKKFRENVLQHGSILNRGEILTAVAGDYMKKKEYLAAEAMLRSAQDYGWDSALHARRLSEALGRQGRRAEAEATLLSFVDRHPTDGAIQVMAARVALRDGDFASADAMLTTAIHLGGPPAAHAASLLVDVDLERRASERGLSPEERPAIWWMKQPYPGNLGDVLNPYIIEKVTGVPPRFMRQDRAMLAIGSVIKFAGDGCDVWGSGTPRMTDELNPRAIYHAVRGPLTRELVQRSGGTAPEVFGDPALLMPRFYAPSVEKKYPLGVIRHVADREIGTLAEGVRDLNLLRVGYSQMELFVDELLECEAVVSTSLHGVILANAYGIPARWAYFSNSPKPISGDGTKFIDYFRSVRTPEQTALDLAALPVLDEALLKHVDPESADIQFDGDALLQAYPQRSQP